MPNTYTQLSSKKSYNISEAKLKRILEYNERLQEQLELPRIPVSEASKSLVDYCNNTRDPLIPSIWGPISKDEDPFAPVAGGSGTGGCCVVM
ncbi:G-protein gamma-like domain-containing protein [Gilbertella persicaria]|uniref:G-protein gamma-like domain-containing protein n=1 Tax=Gilbertella persicaria TaxID=101096 RepID=UPI00221F24B9|nr:G-protein gamma-like domain-containing protein [Gilbertella persicaria]KAI8085767.1 G-protein gamma-like domain-containing protein [Gilbertella persicaria]